MPNETHNRWLALLRSEPAPEHGEQAVGEEAHGAGEPAYSEAG